MSEPVRHCYWDANRLVIETPLRTVRLTSTAGIQALKTNSWTDAADAFGETPAPLQLFEPDSPRRMALIQERLSGLKD